MVAIKTTIASEDSLDQFMSKAKSGKAKALLKQMKRTIKKIDDTLFHLKKINGKNGQGKALAIDLYCGLGGWAEGFLAEGWDIIGFDIERHDYGTGGYPGQLVIQDVTTLHGSQFKNAHCIVASPPCQAYSYRAMPWKRVRALPPPDNTLFDACFRIQREACEAAGRYIPMIVENVRGAQKWVGRAAWHFSSYYLWGDVPALMPFSFRTQKFNPDGTEHSPGSWFKIADSKVRGLRSDGSRRSFQHIRQEGDTSWFYDNYESSARRFSSKSRQRKAWSAQIAKIPLPLAQHIARCFKVWTG